MELIKPGTRIPFTSYRKIAVILSTAVNLLVLIMLFVKGPSLGGRFFGWNGGASQVPAKGYDTGYSSGA